MVCRGAISGVFAYVVHVIQVCAWYECVRLLSEGAMSGLWRWFVRFGYMVHSPIDARKYAIYGGSGRLLWQVCRYQVAPGMGTLQVLMSKVHQGYHLRISFGKCLSGSVSDSAKATGPPDEAADTQTVGAAGSLG